MSRFQEIRRQYTLPQLLAILITSLGLFHGSSTCAAVDWPPIAPEDLALTAVSQQPGAPAVILLHEETADDPNNNHSVYMRVKVLTEAGRKYADVEIPYSRSDFTISDVSGRTVHADGSIVPFEGKPFDKVAVRTKGSHSLRIHLKSFTLPDVQLGSILDYRYSYRYGDRVFYPPEWILQDELFQEREVFKFIPYVGDLQLEHGRIGNGIAWSAFVPKDHPPMLHNVPRTSLASARQSSEWVDLEMTSVPAVVEEPFMPPRDTLAYRVQFYYTLNSKTEDYWKEEGKYWSKEVEGF